jgi:hypothetical protein
LPERFPFHPNWKTDVTHPAYWEVSATIDHLTPVTRGGYSTAPLQAPAYAFSSPGHGSVYRGHECSMIPATSLEGVGARSMVCVGKWKLALNVYVQRRTGLRLGL